MPKTKTNERTGKKKQVVKKKTPAKKAVKSGVKKTSKKKAAPKGERKYILDSVLVINNANTIHGQLNALINAKADIVIDASSVEMTDTSILQLLAAFVIKIHAEGLKVTWVNPSNELLNRAEILDLTEKLDLVKS